jgi:hypothetical protein
VNGDPQDTDVWRPPELPLAFDADGHPVQVDEPEVYDNPEGPAPERDYAKVIGLLVTGAPDAATAGRRALLLGFILKADGAPRTLADLGRTLGVSKQRAHVVLTQFRALLPEIAREIGFSR